MDAAAVAERLRQVSRLAGSLKPEHRLSTKIDLSAEGVAQRLREASDLLELCAKLAKAAAPRVARADS